MSVRLGLTPDSRWPIGPDALMAATADAGFEELGLYPNWVDDTTADALRDHGLRCDEMVALLVTDNAATTLAHAERLATAAARVEARWVLTAFTVGLTTETAALVERSAAILADAGTAMAVEFSPLGPVDSITAGLEVVAAAGHGAGLLVDTWHVGMGPSTWDDLARLPLEQIAYVQFDDASEPVSDDLMHETMHRRALPGEGILDLERFATTLLDRGWEGLVSLEVLTSGVDLPVPEQVRRIHDSALPYWR
ncbi:MAG TPA: sugar phosphate isomerase/epimerase [Acidimicrobiales bacterium]